MFLGEQDDNNSVVFGDAYEAENKELIFELFGKTPVERWNISRQFYEESNLNAEFKLFKLCAFYYESCIASYSTLKIEAAYYRAKQSRAG